MGRNRFRKGKKDHRKRVAKRNQLLAIKKEQEHKKFLEYLKTMQDESLKKQDVDVIDVDELGDIGDIGDLVEELNDNKSEETKKDKDSDAIDSN